MPTLSNMPNTPQAKRRALTLLWAAMTSTVGVYALIALFLSRTRTGLSGTGVAPDYLQGALQYVGYILPVALFLLGIFVFDAIRSGRIVRFSQNAALTPEQQAWQRISTAFMAMLAIFEANMLVGMAFFLLGSPFERLIPFAVTTVLLMIIGLRRLMDVYGG